MKKNVLLLIIIFMLSVAEGNSQTKNRIILKSRAGGTEGANVMFDRSPFYIGAKGLLASNNSIPAEDDWSILGTGDITASGALSNAFNVIITGMSKVNVSAGDDYGKKLADGGIDRDASGYIGIAGNGIDQHEGLSIGLDLTKFSPTAAVKIAFIHVANANGAGERGVIVNRSHTSKRIGFGLGSTEGVTPGTGAINAAIAKIDVSDLNVYLLGGRENLDMLSIVNASPNSSNSFRIIGLELDVVTNIFPTTLLDDKGMAHPRLLMNDTQLGVLKTKLNNSGWLLNTTHKKIITEANEFIEKGFVFNDPKDPRGRMELKEEVVQEIFYLSYAYRITRNTNLSNNTENIYFKRAKTVLESICNFASWGDYSLDTSEMCFAAGLGYDWLYNDLSEDLRKKLRQKIKIYGFDTQKNMAVKTFWDSTSNWNQVCIGSLSFAALAIYGDQEKGEPDVNATASEILNRILIKNPNSMNTYGDGNYAEGPMYWGFGTSYEVIMLSALESIYGENNEGINRLINTPGFLKSVQYTQFVTGPTSLFFNYNDSTEPRVPLPAAFWMAKKAGKLDWLSEEKKLIDNKIYAAGGGNLPRLLPLAMIYGKDIDFGNFSNPTVNMWSGGGEQPVLFVRKSWTDKNSKYIGIKGGTANYSHAHMDGGTFVYDSQGQRWAKDFGKFNYNGIPTDANTDKNDRSQNSQRWNIFRVSNRSHNTISIKKTTATVWQNHKVNGFAKFDEKFDSDTKQGARVGMQSILNLDNDLKACTRDINIVKVSGVEFLEIKDYFETGAQPIDVYWNMVTKATVATVNNGLKLSQENKYANLQAVSNNTSVKLTMQTNRSVLPTAYNSKFIDDYGGEAGEKMIGYTSRIPANSKVTITVTIKDAEANQRLKSEATAQNIASIEIDGNLEFNEDNVTTYASDGVLFVKSEAQNLQNITVFDMQGRMVAEQKNSKVKLISLPNLPTNQALIVKISSEDNIVVTKKVIIAKLY